MPKKDEMQTKYGVFKDYEKRNAANDPAFFFHQKQAVDLEVTVSLGSGVHEKLKEVDYDSRVGAVDFSGGVSFKLLEVSVSSDAALPILAEWISRSILLSPDAPSAHKELALLELINAQLDLLEAWRADCPDPEGSATEGGEH
jgi:hypothetical protein